MKKDLFDLEREKRIVASRARNIFTPHTPIQSIELFLGREQEVRALIEHLNTPGQHSLLFGDRGVGKSSLANAASQLLLQDFVQGELLVKRCDSTDSFLTIVAEPLLAVGIDTQLVSTNHLKNEGGNAGFRIPGISAGVDTNSSREDTVTGFRDNACSPSWVAKKIGDLESLWLIDEVDALTNSIDRKLLAQLVKLLSDQGSKLKVLLVGIAETAAELTAGHPSVQRCLKETRLSRMKDSELRLIIERGEKELNLNFKDEAISRVVNVSSGYPHFTHLLALKASEDAIADGRRDISAQHIDRATRRAVNDAEGSLKRSFNEAVRSATTDEYRKVLLAAALCKEEEIKASELREKYQKLWMCELKMISLNNYFKRLIPKEKDGILRRIAKGVYKFSDPRMPSYVRIFNTDLKELAEQHDVQTTD